MKLKNLYRYILFLFPIFGISSNISNNNGTLVFSGAGVAGVSYAGAIRAYEEINGDIGNSVSKVAGTSAGSIAAGMVALGYTSDDIDNVLSKLNFNDFLDGPGPSDYPHMFMNITMRYGYYDGEKLHQFLKELVSNKLGEGKGEATLAEVSKETGKQIYIFVTNISSGSYEVLSSEDSRTRDIPLATAMHTSSDIPFFWRADFYTEYFGKLRYVDMNDPSNLFRKDITAYVDGGAVMNYPILYMKSNFPNSDSLGFLITTDEMINWFKNGGNRPTHEEHLIPTGQILDYVQKLMFTLMDSQYAIFVQNREVLESTVLIDRGNISAIDFNLNEQDKKNLKRAGCNAVLDFYGKSDPDLCKNLIDENDLLKQNKGNLYTKLLSQAKNYVQSDAYQNKLNNLDKQTVEFISSRS
ncbi:patatin-like phospholipase family protein [Francisella sp. SYW-2]|uniref:patatin-like phospholipase family protein n=1 Tax=Francisella sp. SYW-2 TaxID=2610886 RepID=UPI00123DBCC8|nr:patatin-like phospholipase family protein [Francisella sp. SYW-2]